MQHEGYPGNAVQRQLSVQNQRLGALQQCCQLRRRVKFNIGDVARFSLRGLGLGQSNEQRQHDSDGNSAELSQGKLLNGEGGATTTGRGCIGIVNDKPRTLKALGVVDL